MNSDASPHPVVAAIPAAMAPLQDGDDARGTGRRLFNRELSWLAFNERVLALARNRDLPLLERVKFLAIFNDNLDEFFQVRVAGLRDLEAAGITSATPDGLSPTEQLRHIRAYVEHLTQAQVSVFREEILGLLDEAGIKFSGIEELDEDDQDYLQTEFEEQLFPVLTPLAVDPAHPFPYISNLSLNLAVFIREPKSQDTHFARVKVPPILPRFVVMPDGERFVPLELVIGNNLHQLFPGMEVVDWHAFRVTRNADLVVEDEEADDLLQAIESELTRRRFGRVVRLEVEPDMTPEALRMLQRELDVPDEAVYVHAGPLDLAGLFALYDLERPELKYESFTPTTPPRLASAPGDRTNIFATIRDGDVLLHHPYDSFSTTVQTFIEEAARDPDVLAIKQTLYRTSGPGSPIVRALIKAAEEEKQVVALVELKARFDEEANIEWAQRLEEAGVHVAYGVVGYKTHTKTSLVVRREGGAIRRYAHLGTGNYNDRTARLYEDIGVLTADPDVGADLSDLFNFLTGYSAQRDFRRLLIAPVNLRERITDLIRQEAAAEDGHIVLKMNALVDADIIEELYAASIAGTPVELIVRGICCLRPGVPGMSENITVRSIVGRYLEHSRIYRFGSPARGFEYLIGSADMMPRNLDRRVEAVLPVREPASQERLQEILDVCLADDLLAWQLEPDARWHKLATTDGVDTHHHMQDVALRRAFG